MWVCDHCGQPMGDQDKKCSMCGTEKTVEKGKKTETAQVSQSFDFSKERTAPQASVEPQTPKVEERFTDQPGEDAQERPLIQIARRLVVMPKFWVIFASVILAFILVPWTIQKINQVSSTPRNEQSGDQINPELRKKFEKVIDDSLPDKQEWGREMLRRRVPTRFPEELVLDINKQDAEVRYEDKKKQTASYRLLVCYHFADAHKKTYIWQPVTFFFEIRNGEWMLIGDRWLREDEVILE